MPTVPAGDGTEEEQKPSKQGIEDCSPGGYNIQDTVKGRLGELPPDAAARNRKEKSDYEICH